MFGGSVPAGAVIVGFAPDEDAWQAGKRLAICGIQLREGQLRTPLH